MVDKDMLEIYSSITRGLLAEKLGLTFDGDRDLSKALGYKDVLGFENYYYKWRRQDMAKAVVNRPIQMTWKGTQTISNPALNDNEEDELKKQWEDVYYSLKLKQKFIRVDKMAALGEYAILLLGFSDIATAEDWSKPVLPSSSLKLKYVNPYTQLSAKVNTYQEDTTNERYGLPLTYNIQQVSANNKQKTLTVHYSRVLHITQETLENEVEGYPILECIYNRLDDLEKVIGGGAETFYRNARPGFSAKVDEKYNAPADLKNKLDEQMKEYEHGLRRFLVNEGVDINPLSQVIADPTANVDKIVEMISSATGIPKRILLGSERGELSSSQDQESWLTTIQTRREEFAETNILYPFIDMLMKYKILPYNLTYNVIWSALYEVSDKDRADVGKTRTEALKSYASEPLANTLISPPMFFKHMLGLNTEQIEEITAHADILEEEFSADEEDEALITE